MRRDKSYWEDKLPNEREKAFSYFTTYRDLGVNRSISRVREKHKNNITKRQLGNYSVKYKWQDRVEAFDEYNRLENEKQKQKIAFKHAVELEEKQEKVLKTMQQDTFDFSQVIKAAIQKIAIDTGLIPNPKTGKIDINPQIKPTSAFNTLSNLLMASNSNQKSMLRAFEMPETINDNQNLNLEADIVSESNITEDIFNFDITSNEFMERELEYMKKLMDEH